MTFASILKQSSQGAVVQIYDEHARLVAIIVEDEIAKETGRLNERIENQQKALRQAAIEIERNKTRLDAVKAELKVAAKEAARQIKELHQKNEKLQKNLDTAREQARAFGRTK